MKTTFPSEKSTRFSGHLRHYHRSSSGPARTWDEWVDGRKSQGGQSKKWLKIVGVLLAIAALGGVVAGLMIELG